MTDQDRNKAWGFTLFGDDIRAEVGGKLSLMGMYQVDMLFPNSMPLPIILPKLVVLIVYYEVHGAIEEDFSFKVSYGTEDNVLVDVPAPKRELIIAQTQATPWNQDISENGERIFNIRIPVGFAPFPLDRMGRIRVRAHYSDGKILKLGSLLLRQIPEAEFQEMMAVKPAS